VRGRIAQDVSAEAFRVEAQSLKSSFSFYGKQLQDHAMLFNGDLTASRREPEELPTGCLVFGDRPLSCTSGGFRFALRVDSTSPSFLGLPLLGVTRRRPTESSDLYPSVAKALGESVLIGGRGEAFARDKTANFVVGFKFPPRDEIEEWTLEPDAPRHLRTAPVTLVTNDVVECRYTLDGHIEYWHNGCFLYGFNTGRPVEENVDYYAVVDVCSGVCAMTLVPPSRAACMMETLLPLCDDSTCTADSDCADVESNSTCSDLVSGDSEPMQPGTIEHDMASVRNKGSSRSIAVVASIVTLSACVLVFFGRQQRLRFQK
jgi:hypothetical protein